MTLHVKVEGFWGNLTFFRVRMKIAGVLSILCLSSVSAFAPAFSRPTTVTQRYMFSGSGEALPKEDDPEQMAAIEAAAKSMGMSVEEYKLGLNARVRFENEISGLRLTGGSGGIEVETDARSPPVHMTVTITDEGKAKGQEEVSKELVAAFKAASEAGKAARKEAQTSMMQFIADEMKS